MMEIRNVWVFGLLSNPITVMCMYFYIYTIYTQIYIFTCSKWNFQYVPFLALFWQEKHTHTQPAVFQWILPEAIGDQLQIVAPVSYLFLGLQMSPKDGDVFLQVKGSHLGESKPRGDEWNGRNGKHLFIAGRTFFPSFFLPEIFLLWSFTSYFCFFNPVGNWLA